MVLAGIRVIIFIDNSPASSSHIRGGSVYGIAAALVAVFGHMAQEFNICIWLARASPKLNISDPATRNVRITSQEKRDNNAPRLSHHMASGLRRRISKRREHFGFLESTRVRFS